MTKRKTESDESYLARRQLDEQRRRDDPTINERIRAQRRKWYATHNGRQRQVDYYAKMKEQDFFKWRARIWSARWGVKVTGTELRDLWNEQYGMYALSGRDLGPDAHLDHIIPASKGGEHAITNLRWLDPLVNVALGAMTDAEFLELCRSVIHHAQL